MMGLCKMCYRLLIRMQKQHSWWTSKSALTNLGFAEWIWISSKYIILIHNLLPMIRSISTHFKSNFKHFNILHTCATPMALYKTGLPPTPGPRQRIKMKLATEKLPGDYFRPGEKWEHLYSNIYIWKHIINKNFSLK